MKPIFTYSKLKSGLIFALFLVLGSQSFAQKDTLIKNGVDIVAQRSEKIIGLQIQQLDTNLLNAKSHQNLSEVLMENSSLFVKSEGRGALSTVSFRGTSSTHTEVLWNGISLKSPMLGVADMSLIPMFFIDELEIAYGGASLTHTEGALGGSVLLNTQADWSNKFGGRFTQGLGSFTTIQDFAEIKLGNKNIQSNSRLMGQYSKNDFPFINKNKADIDPQTGELLYPTERNKNGNYRQWGLMQELYARWGEHWNMSVKYWGQINQRALPFLNTFEGDSYSNVSEQTINNHRFNAEIVRYGKTSKWNFQSAFSDENMLYEKQQLSYESNSHSQLFFEKLKYEHQVFENSYFNIQYQIQFTSILSEEFGEFGHQQKYSANRIEHHGFFSWRQKWTTRFQSVIILRTQKIEEYSLDYLPYLGLDYLLTKQGSIILKLAISKNKHYPSLNDLHMLPGGNPNLKTENANTLESSVEYRKVWKGIKFKNSLGVYYSKIDDWVIWIPSPMGYWTPENVKEVESKGLEWQLQLNYSLKKWTFQTNATYAYISAVQSKEDDLWGADSYRKQLVYVPKHTFNFWGQISWSNLFLRYQHSSYSERFTTSTNEITSRDWLYPYFMNDLSLGKHWQWTSLKLETRFSIYNLFDEKYRSVLGRSMPGRNYMFHFNIQF
ncbi:MAG: TonB-dependent receptor plug domain-containing protein [Bacteroidales bacterium]|nr:TonB-dependent receptor plug domain-containing protein [Bacteroidales bacterium]